MENGRFAFLRLRSNVRWSSWKARSGLPISVNSTFFAKCYGWGTTSEYTFKIGDFAPTGAGWPKISGRRGRPPPTILQKTRFNVLLYAVKSGQTPFFHFVTLHVFDRRTETAPD